MRAIFDANVVVRALMAREPAARDWVTRALEGSVHVVVPDLIYPEIGNSMIRYVRSSRLSAPAAGRRFDLVRRLPFEVVPTGGLVGAALPLAVELGLSVYDGCYAALARSREGVLVTADRALGAAVPRAVLLA